LLFFRAGHPCPWFGGWDELKCVFGVATVAFFNFLEEDWALPAPAAVSIGFARDTCSSVGVGAVTGSVFLCAVAAFVGFRVAFVREVVPALALEASGWFFFDLVDVDPAATDGEPVSDGPVGNVSIDNGEDEVSSLLPGGSSLYGFHPAHGGDGIFF